VITSLAAELPRGDGPKLAIDDRYEPFQGTAVAARRSMTLTSEQKSSAVCRRLGPQQK
jgi:hypothetical protein